jgi:hypothetical protein
MFPLHSLRADCLNTFGFDGFFPTWLNSECTAFAFLFPSTSFRTKKHLDLVGYLTTKLASEGWHCDTMTWHNEKAYTLLDKTYILGPHVEFAVSPMSVTLKRPCTPPTLSSWSIAHVSYDDVNPDAGHNKFDIFLYEAAYPTEYSAVLDALKARAAAAIKEVLA